MARGFALLALLMCASTVFAEAEQLVPLDADSSVYSLNARQAQDLDMFPNYPDVQQVQLYQVAPDEFSLEFTSLDSNRTVRERVPQSLAQVDELRARVSELILLNRPRSLLDQSGRDRLLTELFAVSVFFYGWAVPVALDVDNDSPAWYFATVSLGFFLPYLMTRQAEVTQGEATMSGWGASRGILHGLALWNIFSEERDGFDSFEDAISVSLFVSVAEAAAFYGWARGTDMSDGAASMIGLGGDLGLAWGFGASELAGWFEDDVDGERYDEVGLTVLGLSAAGMTLGSLWGNAYPFTRGDVGVLRTSTLLGAGLAATLAHTTNPEHDEVYASTAMAGSAAGIALGRMLIGDRHYTPVQSHYLQLGTIAGALLGFGISEGTFDHSDEENYYIPPAVLGTLSFLAVFSMIDEDESGDKNRFGMDVNLNPAGLADLAGFNRSADRPAAPAVGIHINW